ncbi:MAG TPA: lipopolysaccharide transport periplasmic protein LptA [Thiobacillaceae bacterium]|nr:lipopolysaccharide transport periplasmic protein LptA [Thiobacillaceae bacterium]HNU64234.1 lipopolysaccharide transport periplasmic protein LptA [Thiobacillaceae bacterium]
MNETAVRRWLPCLLALALFQGNPAWAEKADRDKPINVEADSVRMDDVKRVAVYEGHVVMTQGTLMINAERIEVRQDGKGVISGLAIGNPVYFRQKMDASSEFAEGWAQRIEYDGQGDKIRLLGQARLKRGIEELRGSLITYDSATGLFQAKGGGDGVPGRVRAVIRPRAQAQP